MSRSDHVRLEQRTPLPSVGLVCICGKAVAMTEGVCGRCTCGRVWLVSAMLLVDVDEAET